MLTELQNMKNRKFKFNLDNNLLKKYPIMNYMTTGASIVLFIIIINILKTYPKKV